mgnify:CR=1 FL=1
MTRRIGPDRSAAFRTLLALDEALIADKSRGASRAPTRGRSNHALGRTLRALVEGGAQFDLEDFAVINRLGAYATNGSFEPLEEHYYTGAVLWGNASAAASWESASKRPAWRWPGPHTLPVVSVHHDYDPRDRAPSRNTRLCVESALRCDGAWWRVYALDEDLLKLVRHEGDDGVGFQVPAGSGGKRWRPTRAEWAEIAKRNRPVTS